MPFIVFLSLFLSKWVFSEVVLREYHSLPGENLLWNSVLQNACSDGTQGSAAASQGQGSPCYSPACPLHAVLMSSNDEYVLLSAGFPCNNAFRSSCSKISGVIRKLYFSVIGVMNCARRYLRSTTICKLYIWQALRSGLVCKLYFWQFFRVSFESYVLHLTVLWSLGFFLGVWLSPGEND